MRCPAEGQLRMYLDRGDADTRRHVQTCPRCAENLSRIAANHEFAHRRVKDRSAEGNSDPTAALTRFRTRTERKNNMSEFGKRRLRPVYAAGLVAVLLIALLAISPVRSAAFGLLDVFRVEKFAAITVDVSKLPIHMDHQAVAATTDKTHARPNVNIFGKFSGPTKLQKPKQVSTLQQAEQTTGTDLATAGKQLNGKQVSSVYVTSPVKASYTFDTSKMRSILKQTEAQGVKVPQELDGKTFTMNIPRGVFVTYGQGKNAVVFAQGPSPTLGIPDGVNMDYLRQDFLMMPGLPKDLVAQVRQVKDWKHTLIIPLPPNGKSKDISVNGSDGLLISDSTGKYNVALWQRNGQLYALGGKQPASQVLSDAQQVQYP